MGALEKLRDIVMGSPSPFKRAAIEGAAEIWGYHGCPGYEPAPWGKTGEVPTKPGRYEFKRTTGGIVYVATLLRLDIWQFGSEIVYSEQFDPAVCFRYLCPLPTPPEDV